MYTSTSRTLLGTLAAGALFCGSLHAAQGHFGGGGVHIDLPTAELESGYGLHGAYLYEITPYIAVQLGLGYTTGDYDLEEAVGLKGSYRRFSMDAAIMAYWDLTDLVPYVGVGAGYSFIDFDDINIGDKMSLFYTAGVTLPIATRFSLDGSVRLRHLRPANYDDRYADALDDVNMDAWVLRLGLMWAF